MSKLPFPEDACQASGLVEDDALTEQGRAVAKWPKDVDTLEKYHAKLKAVMDGPTQKIFDALVQAGGTSTRAALAEATQYSNPRSTGFRNPLYRLSGMGVVAFGKKNDDVIGTELMYPPSLAAAGAVR